jgi:membrane associated rhomboid family serine protease
MFIPTGDDVIKRTLPIVTILLVMANVAVYMAQVQHIKAHGLEGNRIGLERFIGHWGLVPAKLADGELTGLLTHMFLHGGPLHLTGNMFFLWAFACTLEAGLGRGTLLGFYFLFGIAAGIAQAAMDWTSTMPMVGASGAVAGLIGAYTILYGPASKIHGLLVLGFALARVTVPAWLFGAFWIGSQLYYQSEWNPFPNPNVAWQAHIGGFFAGAIAMSICRYHTPQELNKDNQGVLTFGPQGGQSTYEPLAADGTNAGLTCPHCGHVLDNAKPIAAGVTQCTNSECRSFICVEGVGV